MCVCRIEDRIKLRLAVKCYTLWRLCGSAECVAAGGAITQYHPLKLPWGLYPFDEIQRSSCITCFIPLAHTHGHGVMSSHTHPYALCTVHVIFFNIHAQILWPHLHPSSPPLSQFLSEFYLRWEEKAFHHFPEPWFQLTVEQKSENEIQKPQSPLYIFIPTDLLSVAWEYGVLYHL